MQKKREKEIIFSKKIDNSIEGFALVLTFIIIGILLQLDNDFLGDANNVFKIIFVVVGILGFFTEIKKINVKNNIKGISDIFGGFIFMLSMYLLYNYLNSIVVNEWYCIAIMFFLQYIIAFGLFLVSIYIICKGFISLIYSVYLSYKNERDRKSKLFSNIVVALSQLLGLFLIVMQIIEIFNK